MVEGKRIGKAEAALLRIAQEHPSGLNADDRSGAVQRLMNRGMVTEIHGERLPGEELEHSRYRWVPTEKGAQLLEKRGRGKFGILRQLVQYNAV